MSCRAPALTEPVLLKETVPSIARNTGKVLTVLLLISLGFEALWCLVSCSMALAPPCRSAALWKSSIPKRNHGPVTALGLRPAPRQAVDVAAALGPRIKPTRTVAGGNPSFGSSRLRFLDRRNHFAGQRRAFRGAHGMFWRPAGRTVSAAQMASVELGNATAGKLTGVTKAARSAPEEAFVKFRNSTESDTAGLRQEIIAILRESFLQKKNSISAWDSGVPVHYNLTLSPVGLWLEDLVEDVPVKLPSRMNLEPILKDSSQLLCHAGHDFSPHEVNQLSIQCGDVIACSLKPRSGISEMDVPDSAEILSRGDVLLISKEDWQSMLDANKTFYEQELPDRTRECPTFLIACQVYDINGRHTQSDRKTIQCLFQSMDGISEPQSKTQFWLTITNLSTMRTGLQELLDSFEREAVAIQTLTRASRFNFFENRLWMNVRNRSRLIDYVVHQLDSYMSSPLRGLFYFAPVPDFFMEGRWTDLPQELKLQLQSVVRCLLYDPASLSAVEAELHALVSDLRDRADLRRKRHGTSSFLVEDKWRRRTGGLLIMLVVKLCLVRRNLCLPGVVDLLHAERSQLPVILANPLSMHKHTVLAWGCGLEAAYLCLWSYWTPSMYFAPAIYFASTFAASVLISFSSFTWIVTIAHVLQRKFGFLAHLLTLVERWLLTPVIAGVVIVNNILKGVVQPLAHLVHKFMTTHFKLLLLLARSFCTALTSWIHVFAPLVRGPLTAFARVSMKLGRFVPALLAELWKYPGIIARVLKSWERRRHAAK